MSYSVINSGINAVNGTQITITAATAGTLLAGFIQQNGAPSSSPPTITGYTVSISVANDGNANHVMYFFYKTAAGGETTIIPAAGSGGTIVQICYWEVSGYSGTLSLDGSIVAVSGTASATAYTTSGITTTGAGTLLLMCLTTGNLLNGDPKAWTASNGAVPVLNGGTGTSRYFVPGSYIPGTTLASVTFTANWTTARASGFLLVPIVGTAPAVGGIPPAFL